MTINRALISALLLPAVTIGHQGTAGSWGKSVTARVLS